MYVNTLYLEYLIGNSSIKYKFQNRISKIKRFCWATTYIHNIGLKNLSDVLEIFVVIPPLIYDCSAALFFLRHKNAAMCHIGSSIVAPSSSQ